MKKIPISFLLSIVILSGCGPVTSTKPIPALTPGETATSTNTPSFTQTIEPTIIATKPAKMWELERSPLALFHDMTILSDNEIWAVGNPNIILHSYLSLNLANPFKYSDIYTLANSDGFSAVDFLSSNDGWVTSLGGKIFHWDGSKWTKVLDTHFSISDMGFSDKNNGWIVGSGDSSHPIILHWDGSKWQNISLRSAIGRDNFYLWSMDAISDANVWAVGVDDYGRGVALNWDGSRWQEIPYQGNEIKSISGISQTDVWAVGGKKGNVISHWDGETWTKTELPASNWINYSILAVSKDNVWAGGYDLVHWNGSEWVNTFYGSNRGIIIDINASPDGEVWALTEEGYILHLRSRGK